MTSQPERTEAYRRNDTLEGLLGRLNSAIGMVEPPEPQGPRLPPLFILGAPRSGTTYCLQWLAASGAFSYPSNFIARFWRAPFIGALAQEMLTNPAYDFRGEFSDIAPAPVGDRSDLGKTSGMLSPNEFWYFWRAIFPSDGDIGVDLAQADAAQFRLFADHLAAFADVTQRPVAMKGLIVNHQAELLAKALPEAVFLFIDRDPIDSAWSLLQARRRIHGDEKVWYSFKTPDQDYIKNLPAHGQVAKHVCGIRRDVLDFVNRSGERSIRLEYQEICESPESSFEKIKNIYKEMGFIIENKYKLLKSSSSKSMIPEEDVKKIQKFL